MPRHCIYCDNDKEESEFSLEHVIPQFMGGAYCDEMFETRHACRACNSILGLDVDASFARAWVISSWLQQSAMACFDPSAPHSLPLWCTGDSKLSPPGMTDKEVCESWLGPLGEQVFWVRPKDEERYWYVGGNPITTKSQESRAYFFFTERTNKAPKITMMSFKSAFKDRKKVKKILCSEITGTNPAEFGFKQPDALDRARIDYFWQQESLIGGLGHTQLSFHMGFDMRFLSKFALGIGYCLLGESFLKSKYATELRKGMWFNNWVDEKAEKPEVYVGSSLMKTSALLPNQFLEEWGVTIYIMPTQAGLGIHLNLGVRHSWTILCGEPHLLTQDVLQKLGGGLVQVIHGSLKQGVLLSTSEFLNYKLGHVPNPILTPINNRIKAQRTYFKDL